MAFNFTENVKPASGGATLYGFLQTCLAAGYTCQASGDGIAAYSATGSVFSAGGASGANGLNNAGAWFRLRMPQGGRELLFVRGSSGENCVWIQYSVAAGFGGGAPSATALPTATDAKDLFGNGAGGSVFFPGGGSYVAQMGADSANGFGAFLFAYPIGGGNAHTFFMIDPVIGASGDLDPYVFVALQDGSGNLFPLNSDSSWNVASTFCEMWNQSTTGPGAVQAYLAKGTSLEGFVNVLALQYMNQHSNGNLSLSGHVMGANGQSGNDVVLPIVYGRPCPNPIDTWKAAPPVGYKGVSSLARWTCTWRPCGAMLSIASPGDRICVNGSIALPWNGATAILS